MPSVKSVTSSSTSNSLKQPFASGSEKNWSHLSQNEQRSVIGTCVLSWLIVNSTYTLMLPFYPYEADQKKVQLPWIGVVFACFHLVGFLMTPVAKRLSERLGNKIIFMTGLFLEASATIGFGFVISIPTSQGEIFLIVCIIIRIIHAIGSGLTQKAAYAIVVGGVERKRQNDMIGLLESAGGFGLFLGPTVGGAAYELVSFRAPFLIMGCLIGISLLAVFLFVPQDYHLNRRRSTIHNASVDNQIAYVSMFLGVSVIIVIMGSYGFMEPILATFLRSTYTLSWIEIGLLFSMMYLTYAILAPMGVYFTRKIGTLPSIWFGILILIFSFLLLGPTKLPEKLSTTSNDLLTDKIWLQIVALVTIGIGTAIGIPPTLVFMNNVVDGPGKQELLAKLSMFSFACGSGGGALASSILQLKFEFKWAATAYAGALCVILFFITLYGCVSCCQADMGNAGWSLNTPSSRSPLFSSTSTNYSIPGQGRSTTQTHSTYQSSRLDDSRHKHSQKHGSSKVIIPVSRGKISKSQQENKSDNGVSVPPIIDPRKISSLAQTSPKHGNLTKKASPKSKSISNVNFTVCVSDTTSRKTSSSEDSRKSTGYDRSDTHGSYMQLMNGGDYEEKNEALSEVLQKRVNRIHSAYESVDGIDHDVSDGYKVDYEGNTLDRKSVV